MQKSFVKGYFAFEEGEREYFHKYGFKHLAEYNAILFQVDRTLSGQTYAVPGSVVVVRFKVLDSNLLVQIQYSEKIAPDPEAWFEADHIFTLDYNVEASMERLCNSLFREYVKYKTV